MNRFWNLFRKKRGWVRDVLVSPMRFSAIVLAIATVTGVSSAVQEEEGNEKYPSVNLFLDQLWMRTDVYEKVRQCTFRSDGMVVATTGTQGLVTVWHTRTGKKLKKIPTGMKYLAGLRFFPRKNWLVGYSVEDKTVRVWDVASGRERWKITPYKWNCSGIAISPDGKSIFTCGDDGTLTGGFAIKAWDSETGKLRWAYAIKLTLVKRIAISRDGKLLAYRGRRRTNSQTRKKADNSNPYRLVVLDIRSRKVVKSYRLSKTHGG